jgi:hypothetical protein
VVWGQHRGFGQRPAWSFSPALGWERLINGFGCAEMAASLPWQAQDVHLATGFVAL